MINSPQLTTPRLLLRPVQQTDAAAILQYRSDSEANQYQGWMPKSIDEVRAFIQKVAPAINEPETWYQLVILDGTTGELVGDVGIHFIDPEGFQAEVGCTLSKHQQGKGYATEALTATIDYLFGSLNKRRILTSIDPRNTASIQLVERLNFRKEGHFKESIFFKGEWVDDVVYAMLSHEWNH